MGNNTHYTSIIRECQELSIYSNGAISYEEAINMGTDEISYILHQYKMYYDDVETNKQDNIKSWLEFAKTFADTLFKLLKNLAPRK